MRLACWGPGPVQTEKSDPTNTYQKALIFFTIVTRGIHPCLPSGTHVGYNRGNERGECAARSLSSISVVICLAILPYVLYRRWRAGDSNGPSRWYQTTLSSHQSTYRRLKRESRCVRRSMTTTAATRRGFIGCCSAKGTCLGYDHVTTRRGEACPSTVRSY